MAIPKRLAKAKTALAIQEEIGCEMALDKSENKRIIEVQMISVPQDVLKTKEEFSDKYDMNYYDNLNHAFKRGIKEKIIKIIIQHNPCIEADEISFFAKGCKIIQTHNEEYEKLTEKDEWEMFPNTCVFQIK